VTRNIAASIRQRLLNHARSGGRPFNEVLQYFALERFLYRMGRSPYRDRLVLKGALMFTVWQSPVTRSTRDIDLLGHIDNTVEQVVSAIRTICQGPAPEDGLRFDAEGIVGERIVEAADYAGVRVRFRAYLGKAWIPMQIDVGFGDPLVPGPSLVSLPAILDLPRPEVQGYSRESAIAEKLQVMIYLGEINSRMKNFYDVWLLASSFQFDGLVLAEAIRRTFDWRQTTLSTDLVAFTDAFAQSPETERQWRAFVDRHRLQGAPETLQGTVKVLSAFLLPVVRALSSGQPFDRHWSAGGPWT
jgi:predicted nucleotidyltransferase component of viral defense system